MFRLGTALFAELAVSPGLMPRPSLSAGHCDDRDSERR